MTNSTGNVAIGLNTNAKNLTGNYCVAIGANALFNNLVADNVAIGTNSLAKQHKRRRTIPQSAGLRCQEFSATPTTPQCGYQAAAVTTASDVTAIGSNALVLSHGWNWKRGCWICGNECCCHWSLQHWHWNQFARKSYQRKQQYCTWNQCRIKCNHRKLKHCDW
jgi:hypothetical protein